MALIIFAFKNPPPLLEQVGGTKSTANTPAPTPAPERNPELSLSSNLPYSPHLVSAYPYPPPPQPPYLVNSPHSSILFSPQLQHQQYPPQYFPQYPTHFSPHFTPHSPHSPPSAILVSPRFQPHLLPSPHSPHLSSPLLAESPFRGHSAEYGLSPETPSQSPPTSPPSRPITPPADNSGLTQMQKIIIFGVFLMLNLLVRLVLGIIETIGTPVYIDLNGGKPGKDIEAGFVFGGMGLIGMGVLFLISYLSKRKVKDFNILVVGLSTLVLGTGLLIGHLTLARFIIGCGFIWCVGYPLAQVLFSFLINFLQCFLIPISDYYRFYVFEDARK